MSSSDGHSRSCIIPTLISICTRTFFAQLTSRTKSPSCWPYMVDFGDSWAICKNHVQGSSCFFFFCSTIIFNRLNCILFLPTTIYWMCSRLQCTKRTLEILYTVYITQNDWYKLWFFFLLTFKWLWAAQIAGICFFFFFNFLFVCVYILFNTITASTSW